MNVSSMIVLFLQLMRSNVEASLVSEPSLFQENAKLQLQDRNRGKISYLTIEL